MKLNFELKLNQHNEWKMQSYHFHEHFEILLSLSDAGSVFIENTLYPLQRGTLIIMNNTVLHRTIVENEVQYNRYVLHFDKETLDVISTKQSDFQLLLTDNHICLQLDPDALADLINNFESCLMPVGDQFGEDLKRDMEFIALMIKIYRLVLSKAPLLPSENSDYHKVAPIITYIHQNLHTKITLNSISEHFFINKYHLCHTFKSAIGFSVMEYIVNNRILQAKEYLRQNYSVQEAGEKSGFNNNSHFIRTFTKLAGISPGRYQRKYKNTKGTR